MSVVHLNVNAKRIKCMSVYWWRRNNGNGREEVVEIVMVASRISAVNGNRKRNVMKAKCLRAFCPTVCQYVIYWYRAACGDKNMRGMTVMVNQRLTPRCFVKIMKDGMAWLAWVAISRDVVARRKHLGIRKIVIIARKVIASSASASPSHLARHQHRRLLCLFHLAHQQWWRNRHRRQHHEQNKWASEGMAQRIIYD